MITKYTTITCQLRERGHALPIHSWNNMGSLNFVRLSKSYFLPVRWHRCSFLPARSYKMKVFINFRTGNDLKHLNRTSIQSEIALQRSCGQVTEKPTNIEGRIIMLRYVCFSRIMCYITVVQSEWQWPCIMQH